MTRSGESKWRSLLRRLRDRRPESQNLFRYFATEEPFVAIVKEPHPETPEAEPERHTGTALGSRP